MTVVLSYDLTLPVYLGPVPTYVNINFSASAGFGAGVSVKAVTGIYGVFKEFDFDFSGLTINIRLALLVSFGLGMKGVFSVWIGAGGSLDLVIQFVRRQPVHIAAYLQASIQVGGEIFFISYSRTIVKTPKKLIYSNFNVEARRPFYLLMAWAEADEATQEPDTVELEPQRYAALAPEATAVLTNEKEAMAAIRVAEVSGHSFIFYITGGRLSWLDLNTGNRGVLSDLIDDRYGFIRNRKDYDFDVASDGNRLAIIACCADAFDADGYPKPSGSGQNNRHAYLYAVIARYAEELDSLVLVPLREDYNRMLDYKTLNQMYTGKYNIGYHPQIGVIRLNDSTKLVSGSLQARHDATGEQGILSFQLMGSTLAIFSDAAVQSAIGEQNERTQMSNMITVEDVTSSRPYRGVHSSAFIALSTQKDGAEGDGDIELYDYAMNVAPVQTMLDRSDPDNTVLKITSTERKAVALTTGDIGYMEVIQSVQNGNTAPARTIFYTQTISLGDREENRLKSIYLAPKKTNSEESFSYDMTYTDYDLSLTDNDFRAVTLGASQYLYWLSTAPRENESDPNIWRISAVYYDSATGSVSDDLVLAEFTLPEIDGHTSVPGEIMLTASGVGYITAKPDLGTESGSSLAPMTLYSFPVTLQPVATLKGASVMDTTVSQGDFVTMDLSMMNEGNMGIGSFEADVVLMENGVQKEVVETIYANCLNPADSRLVMRKTGETVATGESAIYRYKDFVYTPRQKEWIVKARNKTLTVSNGTRAAITDGTDAAKRITTDVLVPGALGGYNGNLKIPKDWHRTYELRIQIRNVTTYTNWLAASALAKKRPELFTSESGSGSLRRAGAGRNAVLAAQGIRKLEYVLDENKGKMVLRETGVPSLMMASAVQLLGRNLSAGEISTGKTAGTERLYASEMEAPRPASVSINVLDLDVSHRVYQDYYGEDMLEICIHNNYNNEQSIRLYCMVYEDDSQTSKAFNLPNDQQTISAGKTQTITVPLSSLTDPTKHEKIRFVLRGIGVNEETSYFNNEFEVYLGGTIEAEPTATPVPKSVPRTGDSASPVLWGLLLLLGLLTLPAAAALLTRRRKR